MRGFNNEIYHVWRPEFDEVAQQAIRQHSDVEIHCHMPLDECNSADVELKGRFLAIDNFQAQFLVESYDLELTKNYAVFPDCEYSFAADAQVQDKMEYAGRAIILDTELKKNNLPAGLLLKLSPPTSIRRVRRHERIACADSRIAMPGLMLIDQPPQSKKQLLALLAHYYKDKKRPRPELVNISAGGVCLKTKDMRYHRLMGTDENYLFFFFSDDGNGIGSPHVFLCKKVGIFRGTSSLNTCLRIKFLKELVWELPENELKWVDVEKEGSRVVQIMLSGIPDNS